MIEELARKEFRLGSYVNVFWPNLDKIPMKFFKVRGARRSSIEKAFFICFVRNSNKTQARIAFESDGYLKVLPIAWVKSIGNPILIGDVFEKIKEDGSGTVDGWNTQEAAWIKLCELWRPLGFTKSLQEIAEMIEWEDNAISCPDRRKGCLTMHTKEIAKPSPATSLFLFLHSMHLTTQL